MPSTPNRPSDPFRAPAASGSPAFSASSEAGFTLIEVVISALLVSLIVIGTLSGFDAAGRASYDERVHAEATVIAQQDEERLRGMTRTQLAQLGSSTQTVASNGFCVEASGSSHVYCQNTPYKGEPYKETVFTVSSSAHFVTASQESISKDASTSCTATSTTALNYLQTTSSVTWPALGSRAAVKQSSLINDPASGAGLLVKVINQNEDPVEGATVNASGTNTSLSQLTSAEGCVIAADITDTTVTVTASKSGWVNTGGESVPSTSVALSKGTLATPKFQIGLAGGITAEFKSSTGTPLQTFVAYQGSVASPSFFIGGSATGHTTTATLQGLFPFVKPGKPAGVNPYAVYAGDCEANNPETVSAGKVAAPKAQVNPGEITAVKVEEPPVTMTVYEGSSSSSPGNPATGTETEAKITNTECAGLKAHNVSSVTYQHTQKLLSGALQYAGQPYAKKLKVCVGMVISGTHYIYSTEVANTEAKGVALGNVYLKATGTGHESGSTKTC